MARTGKKEKRSMAWGWVIFWLIIFWPLGLPFLFKKINRDKAVILNGCTRVTVVSIILVIIGIFIFSVAVDYGDLYTYLWAVALIGGGVWTFFTARRMKIAGERYKKYISIIVNQGQTSIDNIASAVGVTYELAAKDLQKMIDLGYFAGAYIDVAQREIVLAQISSPQEPIPSATATAQAQERVATCGSCGANNRIVGQIGECEYCASPLQ